MSNPEGWIQTAKDSKGKKWTLVTSDGLMIKLHHSYESGYFTATCEEAGFSATFKSDSRAAKMVAERLVFDHLLNLSFMANELGERQVEYKKNKYYEREIARVVRGENIYGQN